MYGFFLVNASFEAQLRLPVKLPPTEEYVQNLQHQMKEARETLRDAYVVEMGGKISTIADGVSKVKEGVDGVQHGVENIQDRITKGDKRLEAKDEAELLKSLVPPDGSLHYGKEGCLQGTRIAIIEHIRSWALDGSTAARLFWEFGVAGCGKSSLAVSIAKALGDRLDGSFFCSKRDKDERRNPVRLFSSIAYFLATPRSPYREALLSALQKPDASINSDLKSQFENLIERPLNEVKASKAPSRPFVFIIDALDECDDYDRLAPLLTRIVRLAPWVKFVVTSRHHEGISRAFDGLGDLTKKTDLFEENALGDIRTLLEYELSPHGRLARHGPFTVDRKEQLVARSQGLFVWLNTIINFITADEENIKYVDKILGSTSSEAEAELYALYRTVVETAASKSKTSAKVVRMIIGIIHASSKTAPLSAKSIHAFLPPSFTLPLELFEDILARLSAIIRLGTDGITVMHTSVLDFFGDKAQCGEVHWIDPVEVQRIMASGCFEIMKNGSREPSRLQTPPPGLRFNMCNLQNSHLRNDEVPNLPQTITESVSPELRYSCMFWADHFIGSRLNEFFESTDVGVTGIPASASSFICSVQSLYWVEAMTLFDSIPVARDALFRVDSLGKVRKSSSSFKTASLMILTRPI